MICGTAKGLAMSLSTNPTHAWHVTFMGTEATSECQGMTCMDLGGAYMTLHVYNSRPTMTGVA